MVVRELRRRATNFSEMNHVRVPWLVAVLATPYAAAFTPALSCRYVACPARSALLSTRCAALAMQTKKDKLVYKDFCLSSMPSPSGTATLTRDQQGDEERSPLLEKLEHLEGMWYSDDFYGFHGREWVEVSATLVGAGTSSLVAVKVLGDANVPSGMTTWRTKGLPDVNGGGIPAEVQVRADPRNPNGFSWVPGELVLVAEDRIALSAIFSASQQARGTFYRHKVGEGA